MSAHGAARRLPAPVLGMGLFIASEVMFFGSLFGAYFTIRSAAGEWPPPGSPEIDLLRPGLLTLVLASSSLTQHAAARAQARGDGRRASRLTLVTAALGALFLAGEAMEWVDLAGEGFTASANVFGTLFFTMTGAHGLHLLVGLVILGLAAAAAPAGERAHARMEAATYYWHFVDGVWLLLAASLYLLNA